MSPGSLLPERLLFAMAREHIEAGRLPACLPREVCARYGSGLPCRLCGREITQSDVEYEITDAGTGARFTLHRACHTCWRLECLSGGSDAHGRSPGT